MKSNSLAERGFMTRGIARERGWQHTDVSEVISKQKTRGEKSFRDSARHVAIGKLSLENSLNEVGPPPAFAARGTAFHWPTGEIGYCFRLIVSWVT